MPRTKTSKAEPTPPIVAPEAEAPASKGGKLAIMVALMRRTGGATLQELVSATGWQAHSIRGAIAGAVKKKLNLQVSSTRSEAGRVYAIEGERP